MPELPEVETTRRGVAPHLEGASITAVAVREPRLRWPVSPELAQMATGQRVHKVSRRAKYLIVHLERGAFMIHLGMSGSLRILPVDAALQKHDHIDWVLDSGQLLRYRDPRRFGSVFWLPDLSHPLLDSLGPEPLSEAFSAKYLYEASRGKQRSIKGLIMDAKIVVGVGNIYANEALYRSGIRPTVLAGKISLSRYLRLVDASTRAAQVCETFYGRMVHPVTFDTNSKCMVEKESPATPAEAGLKVLRLPDEQRSIAPLVSVRQFFLPRRLGRRRDGQIG